MGDAQRPSTDALRLEDAHLPARSSATVSNGSGPHHRRSTARDSPLGGAVISEVPAAPLAPRRKTNVAFV
jgi:hypothetical protein